MSVLVTTSLALAHLSLVVLNSQQLKLKTQIQLNLNEQQEPI